MTAGEGNVQTGWKQHHLPSRLAARCWGEVALLLPIPLLQGGEQHAMPCRRLHNSLINVQLWNSGQLGAVKHFTRLKRHLWSGLGALQEGDLGEESAP